MNMHTITALVVAAAASLAAAAPAWSAPLPTTVRAVLLDHDRNVLTFDAPVDFDGNAVQDGDFLIFRIPTAADVPVGNGIDDRTKGVFDFRTDPLYPSFIALLSNPGGQVSFAQLELVLTPRDSLFINDQINLENGPFLADPAIGNQILDASNPFLSNGNSKVVTLDLQKYYSNEQLVNFLSAGTGQQFMEDGRIIMTYGDDSIVTGAALTLTANVPEPGTLVLASLGLVGLISARRLRRAASA